MIFHTIFNRRSIRKYKADFISKETIETIIKAGNAAPSSKNRQPWQWVVVSGTSKAQMCFKMEEGLKREALSPLLPESKAFLSGARHTLSIMRQAPVIRFGLALSQPLSPEERVYEICNAQSIGAAIENMTLAATALGLGSLWICDTYFAYPELKSWYGGEGEPIAALALGFSDESPRARPRRALGDTVVWRN